MGRQARWIATATIVVIALAGALYAVRLALASAPAEHAGWLESLEPVQGQWVSGTGFAYDGSTPWTAPVRLSVDGDELRFDLGCNRLTVTATVEDHRLQPKQGVRSTEIGCPPNVAAHEAWLAALVADRAQVQLQGSTEGVMFTLNSNAGWIGFLRD